MIIFFRIAVCCCLPYPATSALHAAELIVVESDDCPYCVQFHAEVGEIYPKTEEGKRAPLRTWQLGTPFPENYLMKEPVTFTPTFILIDNNKEVDRLVGYQGDEFFWYLINEMLGKLKQ